MIALTIAGSDSSGGAGIQADLKTFSALGVYGASAITALTAQNTLGVTAVHKAPPDIIAAQIAAVMSDLDVKAIKTGMLADSRIIHTVLEALKSHENIPLVVDPVMVSQSGHDLLEDDAVIAIRDTLMRRATLITPNLPEAAKLLGAPLAQTEDEMLLQAQKLSRLGAKAVLLKGGHATGDESIDIFVQGENIMLLKAPRLPTRNTHGTGCSLSAAITAYLAGGEALQSAVQQAKTWLTEALRHADEISIGQGAGPVHHFHELWKKT
ncbi:MAG: bifunctional hydroxymethylpyrimidine kinase/phosphomethylpyrimidine kinase [Pseudomonadota bacterium]